MKVCCLPNIRWEWEILWKRSHRLSFFKLHAVIDNRMSSVKLYDADLRKTLVCQMHSLASPSPLQVVSVVVAAGLHSFLRTTFASALRENEKGRSEHWLFWCGVFIQVRVTIRRLSHFRLEIEAVWCDSKRRPLQIGSFLGSAVMFPLINYTSLFQSAPMCQWSRIERSIRTPK